MILLFELKDNNMVGLNKEWISTIPQFRRLLARDKGGAGDGSGKYKKQATREFTYIFHLLDFHSPLENYPKAKRKQMALEFAGLAGKETDVDNDADLQDAIELYAELLANSSTSLQTLRAMKSARQAMDSYLETVDFSKRDDKGQLVHSVKQVQDNIIGMPKAQAALDDMEEKVKQEMLDTFEMRGGAEKGYGEDPEDDD
jgi:hypothetical protein